MAHFIYLLGGFAIFCYFLIHRVWIPLEVVYNSI